MKEKTCPFDKCPYKELDDIGNYEIETAKIIELLEGEDEDQIGRRGIYACEGA